MDHQSQNVESAIAAILNQLTDDQIAWAADPARGVFRGYPALYDILDAGRLLPASDNPDSADHIGFCNLVIAGVTRRIAPPLPA